MGMSKNFDFKDKKYANVKEGFPHVISISCKVVCPWSDKCVKVMKGTIESGVCVNYEPTNVDFENTSLKCSNWRENAVPKKRSNKKIL